MAEEKFEETRETVPAHEHEYGVGEGGYLLSRIIYYLFGILETVLAFRLVFRILGANPGNSFVSFIYDLSYIFTAPFQGIFPQITAGRAILEPSTIIAMLVYGLIAWALVSLVYYLAHTAHAEREVEHRETRYRHYRS